MIKVLVVEDEELIQKSIHKAIEMTRSDFQVVGTAYNGKEAISFLEQQQMPDVIFTDIRMPLQDGIELIKHVKAHYPNIVTIILSGHQEFEYAKSAIQLGVTDYLLKPISLTILRDVMDKVADNWYTQRKNLMVESFSSILHNRELPSEADSLCNTDYAYIPMLVCAGPYLSTTQIDIHPAKKYWEQFNTDYLIQSLETPQLNVLILDGITEAEKLFLFYYDKNNEFSIKPLADQLFQLLVTSGEHRLPVTVVVSSVITEMKSLAVRLKMLQSALYHQLQIGISKIIYLSDQRDSINEALKPLDSYFLNKLTHALEQNNPTLFTTELQNLVDRWTLSSPPQFWVEKQLNQIIALCESNCILPAGYHISNFHLDILKALSCAQNYEELQAYLARVFNAFFIIKTSHSSEKESSVTLMNSLDYFIQTNFTMPLHNQLLEEKFGLSSYYLSKMFSNYKGMSPTKYMTYLRIEKAKELLLSQPELLAKDIAAIVGYEDSHYFSKIFKKETGSWPSDYRNQVHV